MRNRENARKKREIKRAYKKHGKSLVTKPQFFRLLKINNSDSDEAFDLKTQKTWVNPKTRVKKILKACPKILWLSLLGYLTIQSANDYIINHRVPPKEPDHTYEDYIDDNGNDLETDDKGQIVVDKTTPEEKAFLTSKLNEFILQDANTRNPDANISEVSNIISISLVPYNLCSSANEYDKYYVSILFNDDKDDLYTLNYLTGQDFQSDAELSKDYFTDTINFLSYDCALDSCSKMGEKEIAIKDAIKTTLGKDVIFVGEPYLGYSQSNDEAYYVPVYYKDGTGTTFYSLASQYYDEDPAEKFYESVALNSTEFEFIGVEFEPSESFQKFLELSQEYKNSQSNENESEAER